MTLGREMGLTLAVLLAAAASGCASMATKPGPATAGTPPASTATHPAATSTGTTPSTAPTAASIDTTTPSPAAERVLASIPEPLTPAQQALNATQDSTRAHGTAVARTMGMTTFAVANVFFSFAVKDELGSIFTVETFADRRLLKATAMSAIAILFGTELGILQRILGTVSLTGKEWIVCILAASSIIVASEIQKLIKRHQATSTGEEGVEEDAAATGLAVGPTAP